MEPDLYVKSQFCWNSELQKLQIEILKENFGCSDAELDYFIKTLGNNCRKIYNHLIKLGRYKNT
jgi:hypothetical protein